jgi:hypothetical protein
MMRNRRFESGDLYHASPLGVTAKRGMGLDLMADSSLSRKASLLAVERESGLEREMCSGNGAPRSLVRKFVNLTLEPTESAYVDEVDSEDESMLDFE